MKKNELVKKTANKLSRIKLKAKKHSPEILIVVGVIGTVTSAVMACKATTKLSDILDESKEEIDKIHECSEKEEMAEKYSKEDAKKDLTIVYVQTGVKVAKLYAPAVIIGALSLTSIVVSHDILRKRNLALAAAYAAADKSFKEYRERVVERYGEEVDNELRYNIKAKKVEETVTDPGTGKEKKKTSTEKVAYPTENPYMMIFDESCKAYHSDVNYNRATLRGAQNFANDRFNVEGFLCLNDIYDQLGKERTKLGQIVGWVKENPDSDGYVDFRVYETKQEDENGKLKTVFILDFNVDGNILDLI